MQLLPRFSLVLACLALPAFVHAADFDKKNCTYKGIRLYGKVQIVHSFPDIKVQATSSFPDLKVKVVDSFADSCGEWKIVTSFPDFKVQMVSSFPDLKVDMGSSSPGVR
ncbi:hypothetical protein [Delftia acidovorans]|jgi:hypothetical protein|uniref:hypothetical protein n=1 Tax=Delftia acidovorans TaxID=80866 RepID=UPI00285243A8|nr:hypothetical protein [Delftia acidovorans]